MTTRNAYSAEVARYRQGTSRGVFRSNLCNACSHCECLVGRQTFTTRRSGHGCPSSCLYSCPTPLDATQGVHNFRNCTWPSSSCSSLLSEAPVAAPNGCSAGQTNLDVHFRTQSLGTTLSAAPVSKSFACHSLALSQMQNLYILQEWLSFLPDILDAAGINGLCTVVKWAFNLHRLPLWVKTQQVAGTLVTEEFFTGRLE